MEKVTHIELTNGYTRIANELLEVLFLFDFSGTEYKMLFQILRLSYGCGKKSASFTNWSDFESFGVYRQNVKPILTRLNQNKVIAVDWERKTVAINKYYEFWTVEVKQVCDGERIKRLRDHNLSCNEDITDVMSSLHNSAESHNTKALSVMNPLRNKAGSQQKSNELITKVMSSLQKNCQPAEMCNENITECNEDITTTPEKANVSAASDPPKESKEIKNNNDHDLVSSGIQSDLTIIQGAILQKWGKQIIDSPPVSHITTAIEEYGKDKLLEAITRTPLILKKPDPMTLMTYIGRVAEHPTWYVLKETHQPKSKKAMHQERINSARRVYEAILNDEQADKGDESYKQALEQAKEELERAEEVYNVSWNA